MKVSTLLVALAACVPGVALADGGGYWDFRAGLGSEPKADEAKYEFHDSTPDVTQDADAPGGSIEFNVSHRFSSRSGSPHGAFVTFGGFLRGFDSEDRTATHLKLSAIGIQGGGGYSLRPNSTYTFEVGPRVGIGFAGAREEVSGQDDLESDAGGYARFDLAMTHAFNFQRFQFGATLGVASWAATARYDAQWLNTSGGTVYFPGADVTYSGSGGYITLVLGFR